MPLTIYYHYLDEPEKVYRVDSEAIVVGRSDVTSASVDLDLSPDRRVSRTHIHLYYDRGTWWVKDLNSTHGTFYNGVRVTNRVPLETDAILKLGDTELRLEFTPSKEDTISTQEGVIGTQFTINKGQPVATVSETERVSILARVFGIYRKYQGVAALEALLQEVINLFPGKADHAGILLYGDKELMPMAYVPAEKLYVSFTLARRAIYTSSTLLWERSTASGNSRGLQSLRDVVTTIYAPIMDHQTAVGVLYISSVSIEKRFDTQDAKMLTEIAAVAVRLLTDQPRVQMFPSVFVSYSHDDRAFVDRLANDLRRKGISVWFDERLRVGEEWEQQLNLAIEATDAFTVVISEPSMASKFVKMEIDEARRLGKKILPLLYSETEQISQSLSRIQYIDIQDNYEKGLTELSDEIHRLKPG